MQEMSRLTPTGWFFKFILIPIAVGAIGYYVVGPKIVDFQRQPVTGGSHDSRTADPG